MNNTLTRILACAGLVITVSAVLGGVRLAEEPAPPPKVKLLMENEVVSSVPSKEAYLLDIDWGVGSSTGRHIHPGDEYAEIVEGELKLNVDGQPPKGVMAGKN